MIIENLNITPQKNGVGVIVNDFDLSHSFTPKTKDDIQELLNKYKVVIFRNQKLSDIELESFAFSFGPRFIPDHNFPVLGSGDSSSAVVIVGNQAHEFKKSYLGHQEVLPHSDHQWLKQPSAASILFAVDIERNSAPTSWIDMVDAYDQLDPNLQERITDLKLITFNPFHRPFGSVRAKYVNRSEDVPPGETIAHPLVRTHPLTGSKILYLHAAYEMELKGVSYAEGSALIASLQKHISKLNGIYSHQWRKGDLVFWDNRSTLHYRPLFDAKVRRVLKRVTIGGEVPH